MYSLPLNDYMRRIQYLRKQNIPDEPKHHQVATLVLQQAQAFLQEHHKDFSVDVLLVPPWTLHEFLLQAVFRTLNVPKAVLLHWGDGIDVVLCERDGHNKTRFLEKLPTFRSQAFDSVLDALYISDDVFLLQQATTILRYELARHVPPSWASFPKYAFITGTDALRDVFPLEFREKAEECLQRCFRDFLPVWSCHLSRYALSEEQQQFWCWEELQKKDTLSVNALFYSQDAQWQWTTSHGTLQSWKPFFPVRSSVPLEEAGTYLASVWKSYTPFQPPFTGCIALAGGVADWLCSPHSRFATAFLELGKTNLCSSPPHIAAPPKQESKQPQPPKQDDTRVQCERAEEKREKWQMRVDLLEDSVFRLNRSESSLLHRLNVLETTFIAMSVCMQQFQALQLRLDRLEESLSNHPGVHVPPHSSCPSEKSVCTPIDNMSSLL